jgi:hypothetical protein
MLVGAGNEVSSTVALREGTADDWQEIRIKAIVKMAGILKNSWWLFNFSFCIWVL